MRRAVQVLLLLMGLYCQSLVSGWNHGQALADWNQYKRDFLKDYTNAPFPESTYQYYYNYNKNLIASHNQQESLNRRTFTLRPNQFTDMRLIQFNALFPVAIEPSESFPTTPPTTPGTPPSTYDPFTLGLDSPVLNQGSVCSSGWAYATAKSVEVMAKLQIGTLLVPLSAQNLIDCAGGGTACTTQAPRTAFNYLTRYAQPLHSTTDYPNNNAGSVAGMCLPRGTEVVQLASYGRITDGDDESVMRFVAAGNPVVVEYNPTSFEFMHYGGGIFEQPTTVRTGSHFLVIIGYGRDEVRGLDYWTAQNSFGPLWGEDGFIRIIRRAANPIARKAIFPIELI